MTKVIFVSCIQKYQERHSTLMFNFLFPQRDSIQQKGSAVVNREIEKRMGDRGTPTSNRREGRALEKPSIYLLNPFNTYLCVFFHRKPINQISCIQSNNMPQNKSLSFYMVFFIFQISSGSLPGFGEGGWFVSTNYINFYSLN